MKRVKFLIPILFLLAFGCIVFSACDFTLPQGQSGSTEVHIHSFGDWEITPATCTEAGLRVRVCSSCGERQEAKIDPVGHSFEEEITDPACTETGLRVEVCKVCGAHGEEEILPALGHEETSLVKKEASCTETGLLEWTCSRCGALRTEEIPMLEHTWGTVSVFEEPTCTEDGLRCAVCSGCGRREEEQIIPALGHDYEEISRQAPTCTEAGSLFKRCRRCQETKTDVLPASGHSFERGKVLSEPTCSKEGEKADVCTVCGAVENRGSIPTAAHAFGDWVRQSEPTCTEKGEEKRVCDVCGHIQWQDVSPTGHTYDLNFTVDIEPTVEQAGSKSKHCLNGCGARTEVTPIEPLQAETTYTVNLLKTTGEALPDCVPCITICSQDGAEVTSFFGKSATFTLPTKNYYVKVSDVPAGYLPEEKYLLKAVDPVRFIYIPAAMIMEAPPATLRYAVGSVMYDMEVTLVGNSEAEDKKVSLSSIFSKYKAVLLNMYFHNCGACVQEMPAFVAAYNTLSPTGRIYGDEVACVMLDQYDTLDQTRQFRKQTNYYLPSYAGAKDIPMYMIHDAWLRAYFTRDLAKAFPTSFLIDCEGVIVQYHTGGLGKQTFIDWMQKGLDRYDAIQKRRAAEGLSPIGPAESSEPAEPAPIYFIDKRRMI